MAHEIETIAWTNQVPWHGLGEKVDDCIGIDDMIVKAGLDWSVETVPCFTEINGERVSINRNALVRSSDNRILTVAGDNWKPMQNKDMLEFFREYVESGGAKLNTAGSLRGGQIVWALAKLDSDFKVRGKDLVEGYLLLTSSHVVGTSHKAQTTSVRVVCANTLRAALGREGQGFYRQNHLTEFDIEAAKQTIGVAREDMVKLALDAEVLAKMKMSEFDTVRLLAKFFQPVEQEISATEDKKRIENLINDPATQKKTLAQVLAANKNAPGAEPANAWGVLNAVTYWADHMAGREDDARMFRSWYGHTGRIKDEVKTELLNMAA